MKRKSIYIGIAFLGLVATASVVLTACSKSGQHEDPNIAYYTCPMHPQIHKDHPGDCPICGMKLVPVSKETSPPAPLLNKERGAEGGVRISADRQQLIGLKTAVVSKGPAAHEIRTAGYVRRDLQPPRPGDPVWIDANLYPNETGLVKAGDEAMITLPAGSGLAWSGRVRSVDPSIDPATRSVRAHIEVPGGPEIRRHNYVNVLIKADLGKTLTVPRSAVIDTGVRKIAFVVHGEHFERRDIKIGPETGDDGIVVLEGLAEGDVVVSSAAFLVDSESRLKAAVSGPSAPACPEGEYWDTGMAMCMPNK